MNPQYRVYVIENNEGRRYIGYSEDIEHRLKQHNLGLSKWTSGKGPWRIVWKSQKLIRSEAFALERKLKKQGRDSGFYQITGLNPPDRS
ncbi:MAG: GIY-YIG nuclease family protein [Opitutales bacterium]|nr:GIY-YIG nuclease family protein [Opitutales bacterium]